MRKRVHLIGGFGLAIVLSTTYAAEPTADGLVPIFNGKSLEGWHISAKTGHSGASGHKSGGRWVIDNGAIVGSQDIPGNGGIILTDAEYDDFEVVLEMSNDFGPDSGLFLRSTEDGRAYQAMIDYHAGGNLMGVYGEGLPGGKPNFFNFKFLDKVTEIQAIAGPVELPVLPESWAKFWRHGEWNELRARIVGNPPKVTTWINGVKFMEVQDDTKRLGDKGRIALQVHGGGDFTKQFVRYRNIRVRTILPDNVLNDREKAEGWRSLFDGKTLDGWMTSAGQESKTPVQDGSINPHKSGHYMMVPREKFENYTLAMDFKISKGCNSGIFVRTSSLTPRPGKDVGFNGIEIAIDDTAGAGYHDTGAIYDLVKPTRNAMKPAGQWNHIEITCDGPIIEVVLNGEKVSRMNCDEFAKANLRPDGSAHKFDVAFKDHPRSGYIGLQDHGSPCWFKNIKVKVLDRPGQ